ncbi:MAG: AlbA family DNA-binding domain-containing protein [Candidatus Helarchaeota archaeon]
MDEVETPEEESAFMKIWFKKQGAGLIPKTIFVDPEHYKEYKKQRSPLLFPLKDYLSPDKFKKAEDDEVFDMIEHQKYASSGEGRSRLIVRIQHGDFGKCPFCKSNLYPTGYCFKPYDTCSLLECGTCGYDKDTDLDGIYFSGWITPEIKDMLKDDPEIIEQRTGLQYKEFNEKSIMKFLEILKKPRKEKQEIDFKKEYEINPAGTRLTNHAKKEIRKDIAAFANSIGGILCIGFDEIAEDEYKPVGISYGPNVITEEFLQQITSDGKISPIIIDFEVYRICYNEKYFVIIEIPQSGKRPHFVSNKIPFRNGTITIYFESEEEFNEII